jgi:hypothetical protein
MRRYCRGHPRPERQAMTDFQDARFAPLQARPSVRRRLAEWLGAVLLALTLGALLAGWPFYPL